MYNLYSDGEGTAHRHDDGEVDNDDDEFFQNDDNAAC